MLRDRVLQVQGEGIVVPWSEVRARMAPSHRQHSSRDLSGNVGDIELVQRVCDGDPMAEEALYRRYAPSILDQVTRLLGSRADAQDVLHDTFVIGLREIRRLRSPGAARAWFLRISVSLVHRRLRRRRLARWLGLADESESGDDAALEHFVDTAASPETRAELSLLDRVIVKLPTNERVAWMLRHVDGHSLPEVAGLCNCSLATVKRRISAADAKIRSHVRIEGDS